MCGLDYVKKFQRAKGREGVLTTFKNLDSLLGLKPILVPLKFLGRFTPMIFNMMMCVLLIANQECN